MKHNHFVLQTVQISFSIQKATKESALKIGTLQPAYKKSQRQQNKVDMPSVVGLKVASDFTFRLGILLWVVELVNFMEIGCPNRSIKGQDTANIFSTVSSAGLKPNKKLWIAANHQWTNTFVRCLSKMKRLDSIKMKT